MIKTMLTDQRTLYVGAKYWHVYVFIYNNTQNKYLIKLVETLWENVYCLTGLPDLEGNYVKGLYIKLNHVLKRKLYVV